MNKPVLPAMTAALILLAASPAYAVDDDAIHSRQDSMGSTTIVKQGTAMSTHGGATSNPDLIHNDYVTLSGTVDQILNADEFTLNYGSGKIKVDTNDSWPQLFKDDRTKVGYVLRSGDQVTVRGRVDRNWTAANEIEAEMVSHDTGAHVVTYYTPNMRSNRADNLNPGYFREGGRMSLTGTVAEIKNADEFILRYSGGEIQVDTNGIAIPSNQRLAVGERVTVYGVYDEGIIERNEIQADGIDRSNYFTRG